MAKETQKNSAQIGPFLKNFSVKGLFGSLNYDKIDFPRGNKKSGRINVIFGDNGAGKTTILNLIYSTLSPQRGVGLRGLIARTPFERFELALDDGSKITLTKDEGLLGSFTYRVSGIPHPISVHLKAEPDHRVDGRQDGVKRLEAFMRGLDFDILFVDHERNVKSTFSFLADISSESAAHAEGAFADLVKLNRSFARGRETEAGGFKTSLLGMIEAVNGILRKEAFNQGTTGDQDASSVYLDIAKAIVRTKKPGPSQKVDEDLPNILDRLNTKSQSFVAHGLLSRYPFDEIKKTHVNAPAYKKNRISDALDPFIRSVEKRISALSTVNDLISSFETELNRFLTNKQACFHILHGLAISNPNGTLDVDRLSSGERQIVFLLCAALISKGTRSLILIDEPELSLNYKWQRMVSGALDRLSSPDTTQFIMASHSIEIITRYTKSATELKSTI